MLGAFSGEVRPFELDAGVIRDGRTGIGRMLEFTVRHPVATAPPATGFVPNLGAV